MTTFKSENLIKFLAARDSFTTEICSATGTTSLAEIRTEKLNKRATTKDMTCKWLESACELLVSVMPLLESATSLSDTISNLKTEKIADSASIISLQKKLIEKKEDTEKISELQSKLLATKEEGINLR